jgi:hypothetical protein
VVYTLRCPAGYRRDWRWYPADNPPVLYEHHGSRFRELRGRLQEDDGQSAAGSIRARAVWTKARRQIACSGTATFRTRRTS